MTALDRFPRWFVVVSILLAIYLPYSWLFVVDYHLLKLWPQMPLIISSIIFGGFDGFLTIIVAAILIALVGFLCRLSLQHRRWWVAIVLLLVVVSGFLSWVVYQAYLA